MVIGTVEPAARELHPDGEIPVKYHDFADLRVQWIGRSAADQVPLLLWRDAFPEPSLPLANFHQDFFSLYVVRRGRGTHVIDGVPYSVARGDVYAMGPGMVHHFVDCHDLLFDTLHFAPSIFAPATLDALGETPGFHDLFITRESRPGANRWLHLTPSAYAEIESLVAELHSEWARGTPDGTLLVPGLFLRLLVRLSRYHAAQNAGGETARVSPTHDSAIAAAVHYMEEHFAKPLRMEQIAALAFLSPHRFTEVFASVMGRTPRDYLRHLRVERAKTLLTTTDITLSEVARASGFGDAAYLTRVLREELGQTPGRIRRNVQSPRSAR